MVSILNLILDNGEEALFYSGYVGFAFGFGLSAIILLVQVAGGLFKKFIDISTEHM